MVRSVPEWKGKTDDEAVPPRVRVRVFDRFGGRCQECTRKIAAGERWVCDHTTAIINGGANRETNLRPICDWCDKHVKTPADVAEKSDVAERRAKHIGAMPKRRSSLSHPTLRKKLSGEVVAR
jgi:5-methylcytosine-specific restriction protein A